MKSAMYWQGESRFTGEPIEAIVGLSSANPKTGGMLELTVLPKCGLHVLEERARGCDAALCGSCPRRPTQYRKAGVSRCYVNDQMLGSMVRAQKAGSYLRPAMLPDRYYLRLTRFGCPTALPTDVIYSLFRGAIGWTGYTAEWRNVTHGSEMCLWQVASM